MMNLHSDKQYQSVLISFSWTTFRPLEWLYLTLEAMLLFHTTDHSLLIMQIWCPKKQKIDIDEECSVEQNCLINKSQDTFF